MLSSSIWQSSSYTFFTLSSQCPVIPLLLCPIGNHYSNKLIDDEFETVLSRMETDFLREGKAVDVERRCAILKTYLDKQPFTVSSKWRQYLNNLIDLAEASKIAQRQKGRCGEGAKQSITLSLIKQLETGFRESIHLISLMETTTKGHSFALYNGEIPDLSLIEPIHIFSHIKQKDSHHSFILCDPWTDYQGHPDHWHHHFKTRTDHSLTNLHWNKISVTNYTLPSLRLDRNEHNVEFRNFMKNLMLNILKGTLNYVDLVLQKPGTFVKKIAI